MLKNITAGSLAKKIFLVFFTAAFTLYFFREFSYNISAIKQADFHFDLWTLALAFFSIVAAYFIVTLAWRRSLFDLSDKSLSVWDSIAVLNIPALGKYIPGKVWSYAFQMIWLDKLGFSKAVVLYNNLLNVAVSLGVACWLGLAYPLFREGHLFTKTEILGGLSILISINLIFVWKEQQIVSVLVNYLNKFLTNKIVCFKTAKMTLIRLQLYYAINYLLFGLSLWFILAGIGLGQGADKIFICMISYALGDAIGFLSLLTPGGLGVREGVMYAVLKDRLTPELALILPLVARVLGMLVEAFIAGISLVYLKYRGLNKYHDIVLNPSDGTKEK